MAASAGQKKEDGQMVVLVSEFGTCMQKKIFAETGKHLAFCEKICYRKDVEKKP